VVLVIDVNSSLRQSALHYRSGCSPARCSGRAAAHDCQVRDLLSDLLHPVIKQAAIPQGSEKPEINELQNKYPRRGPALGNDPKNSVAAAESNATAAALQPEVREQPSLYWVVTDF
jgi:hypothetical protein